jgi:NADH-quinone oxidoreductase subunit J
MSASVIIFYILSTIVLGGGIMAVTSTKIFRAAVFLLFSLLGVAGVYFFLDNNFIAAVQIVVYVGGIIVLIIFSIFLTQASGSNMPKPKVGRAFFSALSVLIGLLLTLLFISEQKFTSTINPVMQAEVKDIGRQMLSTTEHGFVLPFEVVSILLLASMIGCIVIAIKRPAEIKELEQ